MVRTSHSNDGRSITLSKFSLVGTLSLSKRRQVKLDKSSLCLLNTSKQDKAAS
jgi:hypothetical protein